MNYKIKNNSNKADATIGSMTLGQMAIVIDGDYTGHLVFCAPSGDRFNLTNPSVWWARPCINNNISVRFLESDEEIVITGI